MRFRSYLLAALLLAACGGNDGPIAGAEPPTVAPADRVLVSGMVAKGPFVDGTVTVAPAEGGEAVTTDVQDVLGRYAAWVPAAPAFRLEARGRAYRETAGAVAAEPLVLRAFHAASGEGAETVHVNVLTHLAYDRIEALALAGTPLPEAIRRADGEVHRALGIGVPFYEPSRPASGLALLGADDLPHAYLLAAAAVVDRVAGETLPDFLAALALDLADDGELRSGHADRLVSGRRWVDPEGVVASLRGWLERNGQGEVAVPDLRRVLDSDGDGIPDADDPLEVDPSLVAIVRHGVDRPDQAVGAAGAVTGGCPPWSVELFDGAEAGLALERATVEGDGSFAVPFGTADASRPRLWLEAADRCGSRTSRVAIEEGTDETPPLVSGEALSVVRNGAGIPDTVHGEAGAVADPGGAVVAVWITDGPEGPRVALAVPKADGSFGPVILGTPAVSYALPWAEAVDKAGNVSARVAIAAGAAHDLPVVIPERVEVRRRGMGEVDGVAGSPGALAGTCRPAVVRLYSSPETLVASHYVEGDGGFFEISVGTPDSTPARLWLEAADKCGRVGERVEIEAARDLDPPAVDPDRLLFLVPGEGNAISGLPGAVTDASGVKGVWIYRGDCASPIRFAPEVERDGSFPALDLGPGYGDPVACVAGQDKAGNLSAPVASSRVRATLDDRSTGFFSLPEFAFFGGVVDADPRTVAPSYLPWLAPRHDLRGEARVDVGVPETRDLPLSWRWIDLSLPAPDAVVASPPWAGEPLVVLRTMGDWRSMVTLERVCHESSCLRWHFRVQTDGPSRREGMAVAHVPNVGVLAFGGRDETGPLVETWWYEPTYTGQRGWRPVDNAGGPAAAFGRMTAVQNLPVLVAAVEGDPELQVWRFQGRWYRAESGGGPSFRTDFALVTDHTHRRALLFGGRAADGTALGDTWLWDSSSTSWTQLHPETSPPPRWGHGMVKMPSGDVYLRGGAGAGALDTWSWDGTGWTHLQEDHGDDGTGVALGLDPMDDRLFTLSTASIEDGTGLFSLRSESAAGSELANFRIPSELTRAIWWNPLLGEATFQMATPIAGLGATFHDGWWVSAMGPDFTASTRTLVVDTHRSLRLDLGSDGAGIAYSERQGMEDLEFFAPAWPEGTEASWVFDSLWARAVGVGGGVGWALGEVDYGSHHPPYVPLVGTPPDPLELVFDPLRGRTIAHGPAGTYELEEDTWVRAADAPAACPGGSLLFDPVVGKVLKLAGGGCDRVCTYDGAWDCGEERVPEVDLLGAPDVPEGVLVAHGRGSRTWVREGAIPHRRYPVHLLAVQLAEGSTPLGFRVILDAAADRSPVFPVEYEVLAWNWGLSRWDSLGTALGQWWLAATTFAGGPADPTPYFRRGALRLQVVHAGSDSGAQQDPRLKTRSAEVEIDYRVAPPAPPS